MAENREAECEAQNINAVCANSTEIALLGFNLHPLHFGGFAVKLFWIQF